MKYTQEQAVLMYLNHMLAESGAGRDEMHPDAPSAFKKFQRDIAPQYRNDDEMMKELLFVNDATTPLYELGENEPFWVDGHPGKVFTQSGLLSGGAVLCFEFGTSNSMYFSLLQEVKRVK